jgi:hypothetical protein
VAGGGGTWGVDGGGEQISNAYPDELKSFYRMNIIVHTGRLEVLRLVESAKHGLLLIIIADALTNSKASPPFCKQT